MKISSSWSVGTADLNRGQRPIFIGKIGRCPLFLSGEAIVYAAQDIITRENRGAAVEINGTMLASRDISMWNFKTVIKYTHVYITPPDIEEEGVSVVSWNR